MRVIEPILITAAMLTTGVAEPDTGETAWSAATAYAVDQLAVRTATHRIYKRLVPGTTATAPELDEVNWEDYAPTNRWAMFDNAINTQTVATGGTLTVTLAPGQVCNALTLLELVGRSVTITVRNGSGGPVVYTRTLDLDVSNVTNLYEYFFEPFRQQATVVLTDLPPYPNAHITVELTGPGTVKCGQCIVGTTYFIGETKLGAQIGIRNYSRKKTDAETQVVSLDKRKFSRTMTAQAQVSRGAVNAVDAVMRRLLDVPCVWLGDDVGDLEPPVIFGFYTDFRLDLAMRLRSYYTLQIESMT